MEQETLYRTGLKLFGTVIGNVQGWQVESLFFSYQGVDMTEQPNAQQMMQMMQQKVGNLELTVHALLAILDEEGVVDQDAINEKAQEIVEEMQEEQGQQGEDIAEELDDLE